MTMPTPDQTVTTSERLWSEEVGIARAGEPVGADKTPAYEWSNGRTMTEGLGPYSGADQQPGAGA
jgi:hypothetical protein